MSGNRGVQIDLGGFDPRFLGITIRFHNPEEWDRFRYERYDLKPESLLAVPEEDAFMLLAEATVLQHEFRHFHDFLLSPYSQRIFRLKIQAFLHGFQVLALLYGAGRETGANCLPIPVSRWCRLGAGQRRLQIEQWNRGPKKAPGGQGWTPPEIPFLPDDLSAFPLQKGSLVAGPEALESGLVVTIRSYDKIAELLTNPLTAKAPTPLQPWHIMELSALLVQMQEIWNASGGEATELFTSGLSDSGFPASAVRLFQLLQKRWHDRGRPVEMRVLQAVAFWSLMGDYEIDGWHACPTHRIIHLSEQLERNGPPPAGMPVLQMFREWSKQTKLCDPADTMRSNVEQNRKLAERHSEMPQIPASRLADVLKSALSGSRVLYEASAHMLQAFEADPEAYVSPGRYLQSLSRYVRPLVRCEFEDHMFISAAKRDMSAWKHWDVIFAKEDTKGNRFMRTGIWKADVVGVDLIKPPVAIELYMDVLALDFVFQPKNRLDWEFREVAKEVQGRSNLVPLHITG